MAKSKTFLDGLYLAEGIADQVAEEWQHGDNPDWHGGVAAAREIVKRLRQARSDEHVKITSAQRAVLQWMNKEWKLESVYEVEQGVERPSLTSPALWPSGYTATYDRYHNVLYTTLNALLRLGLVEEERRYKSGELMQGDRQWEQWTIVYQLTDKGTAVLKQKES